VGKNKRRVFMKRLYRTFVITAGLVCVAAVLTIGACATTGAYQAGTYQAEAEGRNGPVTVQVTFANEKIEQVKVISHSETPGVSDSAISRIPVEIVNAQSANVDAVAGVTITSRAIMDAVEDCIKQAATALTMAKPTSAVVYKKDLKAGSYQAIKHGHHSDIRVAVTVSTDSITGVRVLEAGETHHIGDAAITVIPGEIVKNQSVNIDVVSGATLTSRAIINAVEDCLAQAGGENAVMAFSARIASPPWSTEEKTVTADVVVVGAGLTGITAALAAQDGGASVVLLEKLSFIGGISQTAAGGSNVPLSNSTADKEVLFNLLMYKWCGLMQGDTYMNGEYPNPSAVRGYVDNALPAYEWLKSKGVGMSSIHPNNMWQTYSPQSYTTGGIMFTDGKAPDVVGNALDIMIKQFEEKGGTLYLETPAVSLITDSSGAAVGVKANGRDGRYTFNSKAVILACGGFGGTVESVAEYAPAYKGEVTVGPVSNTGDGIRMAREIGAAVDDDYFLKGGSGQTIITDADMISPYSDNETPSTSLYVNPMGQRINSEDPTIYTPGTTYINPDTQDYYWIIINEEQAAQAMVYKNRYYPSEDTVTGYYIDILKEELAAGNSRFFKADTIADLARQINITPTVLRYTLSRYNQLCRAGQDTDLWKNPAYLKVMENGPWYAVKAYMQFFGTVGGIVSDENAAVLHTSGRVIPGLYAAGEVSTHKLFNLSYTGGVAVGDNIIYGWIAGKNAAAHAKR
jgi:uncharacterized protein with FMN-binding domain/succinate dehydrogenase/fumarate reductase flavoprotein subunit